MRNIRDVHLLVLISGFFILNGIKPDCLTDSDRENRTIICHFTSSASTNKLTTSDIPLVNFKDQSDNTYRIIDQMAFLVESETEDCSIATLSYKILQGYHMTATCNGQSSDPNQCSCLKLSSFFGGCTFFIDCSNLMRKNSISKVWTDQSPNFIRLKVHLKGGIIKFIKYYQRNFKCKRVDDFSSICNVFKNVLKNENVYCYEHGSITLHGCDCSSSVNIDYSGLSDETYGNSWTSSPSSFIRMVHEHLATAEELNDFRFFVDNACPSNANDGFPLVNLFISFYNYHNYHL
ncbi:hypothetical protein ACHWQZ_G010348 [Mnemiopsis leidyi]